VIDLLDDYARLTKDCAIGNIGEKFAYYYADDNQTQILAEDIIELDITSAFPTICKIIFGKDNDFVKRIFSLESKLERNIFIATTLKQASTPNHNYISDLNMYSKVFCLGKIYNDWDNVNILEYKKDGAVFSGIPVDSKNITFSNYILDNDVKFHINDVIKYMRFNKTSIYEYNNKIDVKGQLKSPPEYIVKELLPAIFSGDPRVLTYIYKIYSKTYMDILKKSGEFEKYKYYYVFDNGKTITQNGTLEKSIITSNPKWILRYFIYPILSLLRTSK
jgi:hypothetical protein